MAAPLRRACVGRVHKLILCQDGFESVRMLVNAHRKSSQKKQEDFFGIAEDQLHADEEVSMPSETEMQRLLRTFAKKQRNSEVVVQANFGQVRLDSRARESSLVGLDADKFLQSISKTGAGEVSRTNKKMECAKEQSQRHKRKRKESKLSVQNHANQDTEKTSKEWSVSKQQATNYFDEQYFGSALVETVQNADVAQVQERTHKPATDGDGSVKEQAEESGTKYYKSALAFGKTEAIGSAQAIASEGTVDNFIDETYFNQLSQSADSFPKTKSKKDGKISSSNGCQSSFIDQQYFPQNFESEEKFPSTVTVETEHSISQTQSGTEEKMSTSGDDIGVIDEQYMGRAPATQSPHSMYRTEADSSESVTKGPSGEDTVSFIDAQYFDGNHSTHSTPSTFDGMVKQYGIAAVGADEISGKHLVHQPQTGTERPSRHHSRKEAHFAEDLSVSHFHSQQWKEEASDTERLIVKDLKPKGVMIPEMEMRPPAKEKVKWRKQPEQPAEQQDIPEGVSLSQQVNQPRSFNPDLNKANKVEDSAYAIAMKMRRNLRLNQSHDPTAVEKLPRDKQRVLVFKEQVPDLHHMPAAEVAKLLADNIIFENDDFIAVDKPYGLPSHGGPGVRVSVGQVLEPLSRHVDSGRGQLDNLHLVHRLDKETTGVMLLAKNAEVAWQLLGMFRRREVNKTYWTLTKGLPQPSEGIIDIPLAREKIKGIYKTVVKPRVYVAQGKVRTQTWSGRDDASMEAVTEYRVLGQRDSMALVECRPLTGVQHQIRAHLAQALNTPVLGDHKYSHMDRLAPQKLFPEALQKLGIRQAQVRHLPMHLHAKALVLPEWRGKTNLFIQARVPKYFLQNLQTLKIKIPPK